MLSHELRNPLVGIAAAAQVLARELPADGDPSMRAASIAAEASYLMSLLDEVMDLSRIDAGTLRSVLVSCDLARVVRGALATLHTGDHPLAVHADASGPTVMADDRRLRQVVANLVANAVAYSPAGTGIEVTVGLATDGRSAVVRVRDHGPGIPPAEQDRLFQRFSRLSTAEGTRGTGLGLYICRAIVADHGGEIWVDQPSDGGTAVSFSLPLAVAALGSSSETVASAR